MSTQTKINLNEDSYNIYNIYNNTNTNNKNIFNSNNYTYNYELNTYMPLLVHTATTVSNNKYQQPKIIQETLNILEQDNTITKKRADNIRQCQPDKKLILFCGECLYDTEIKTIGCGSRLCLFCNKLIKQQTYAKLKDITATMKQPRFLTIGFANTTTIDKKYFLKCQTQFRLFKQNLKREGYEIGTYINVLEVKHHDKNDTKIDSETQQTIGTYKQEEWNTHYHIIYDGDYIPHNIAKQCLLKATKKESYYIYFKADAHKKINNTKKAISYLIKYLSKIENHKDNPQTIATFYKATKNIRFLNISITKNKKEQLPKKQKLTCSTCGNNTWYTPYNVPYEQYKDLLNLKVENSADKKYSRQKLPFPKEESAEYYNPLTAEEINITEEKIFSREDLLTIIDNGIEKYSDLLENYGLDTETLNLELNTLLKKGEIFEYKKNQYKTLR